MFTFIVMVPLATEYSSKPNRKVLLRNSLFKSNNWLSKDSEDALDKLFGIKYDTGTSLVRM